MFIEIKTQEEAGEEVPRGGWCHRAWTRTAALGTRAPDRTGIGRPASFPALQLIAREVFGGGGAVFLSLAWLRETGARGSGAPSGRSCKEATLSTTAMRPRKAWMLVLLLALAQLLAVASAGAPDDGERRRRLARPAGRALRGGGAARTSNLLELDGCSGATGSLGSSGRGGRRGGRGCHRGLDRGEGVKCLLCTLAPSP